MRRVYQSGNMPNHVAAFAQQLTGMMSGQKETEFWEAANLEEFEKNASEIGYEIIPALDNETKRAYLVGFDVETDNNIYLADGSLYAQLKMYFIELTTSQFKQWVAKIKEHRELQQEDYFIRKEKTDKQRQRAKKRLEENND